MLHQNTDNLVSVQFNSAAVLSQLNSNEKKAETISLLLITRNMELPAPIELKKWIRVFKNGLSKFWKTALKKIKVIWSA